MAYQGAAELPCPGRKGGREMIATLLKERTVCLSDEEVRAVLRGQKTQIRRPANRPPFGRVGDRLWVREAFCLQVEGDPPFDDGRPVLYLREGLPCAPEDAETWIQPHYRATDPAPELYYADLPADEPRVRWKAAVTMPRWAARIVLEITGLWIQKIQEVTDEEAILEGARKFDDLPSLHPYGQDPRWSMGTPSGTGQCYGRPRWAFAGHWNARYGAKGFAWESNPEVWVATFRVVAPMKGKNG